jgi:hypothetical protein
VVEVTLRPQPELGVLAHHLADVRAEGAGPDHERGLGEPAAAVRGAQAR